LCDVEVVRGFNCVMPMLETNPWTY
jgi:hypothetical protein